MTRQWVLVTGGTGKTGRRLVAQLRERNIPCRVASRKAAAVDGARQFDWSQRDSWDSALENVSAAYLVAPMAPDPAPIMIDFIKYARTRGVSRFVLLSASLLPAGGPLMGQVHLWLKENTDDWTVLRPSWFMDNFSEGQHLPTIRDEDSIYSAAQDGRVPFISAEDIAASALAALTHDKPLNADFILTSSRPISYDEVAASVSSAVHRTISHHRLSVEALGARHQSRGMPAAAAMGLAGMDAAIAKGVENRVTGCVEELIGRPPVTFEAFVQANAAQWSVPR